ncbi:hypothetical protein AX774_g737 [Zancudomyces culisetae]|uniref:Ankyrin repeat protein n=1 Tax=Zancudomyces culisetae TaxID=1213189 RepID=A0A1R1PXR9_ZANCU|nr:hypothetical protein AX774_g737 [Zancudomyces culisetae]|eukprot:OMH85707.1 hypothetical protein AX774_g737 [Zancudomyces culisetae]
MTSCRMVSTEQFEDFYKKYRWGDSVDKEMCFSNFSVVGGERDKIDTLLKNTSTAFEKQLIFDMAVYLDNFYVMMMLFKDVKNTPKNISSLLEVARRSNDLSCMKYVASVKPNLRYHRTNTALEIAIITEEYEWAKLILETYKVKKRYECFQTAIGLGDPRSIKMFLDLGYSIKNHLGGLAKIAAEEKNTELMQLVIDAGISGRELTQHAVPALCDKFDDNVLNTFLLGMFPGTKKSEEGKENKKGGGGKSNSGDTHTGEKQELCYNEVLQFLIMQGLKLEKKHYFMVVELLGSANIKGVRALLNEGVRISEHSKTKFIVRSAQGNVPPHSAEGLRIPNDNTLHDIKAEVTDSTFRIVQMLIKCGININAHNHLLMRMAYRLGAIKWIDYLKDNGARLGGQLYNGYQEAMDSKKSSVLHHWLKHSIIYHS